MSRPATVVDVAAAAGVSRQTVSNTLNSPERVRPATLQRVQAAIESLGYRPNGAARRLRTRQSSTIGMRLEPVQGISGSVLDRFLHALVESADKRQLRVLLFTAKDDHDELAQMENLIEGSDVDGFVLTSTGYGDPRPKWLEDRGIAFVTFGRPWQLDNLAEANHPWVDVDGRSGTHAATEQLLTLGHRRIGFLGWPDHSGQGDERRQGWMDAMTAAGVPAEVDLRCEDDVSLAAETVTTAEAGGSAIDALVCASDTLALGARLRLAPTVPIIGYDDTPVAAAIGISSVAQPLVEAASAVVELLSASRDDAAHAGISKLLEPHVVWR